MFVRVNQQAPTMKTFKIIHGDDVRVVTMRLEGKCHPTYAELHAKVQSLYPNVADTTAMVYRDAEGDIVTIVDDDSVRAVVIDAAAKQSPNVRITLRARDSSAPTSKARSAGPGCRGGKQQRGQCPQGVGRRLGGGSCSPGGWCMSALSPFSMRSIGVALGLRIIFGMSWCSIFGLGLLRHFYLKSSWRSGCHGSGCGRMWTASYPPWWHIQGPPNFRMSTPFFTVVSNADSPTTNTQCGPKRCARPRHVSRQHATEGVSGQRGDTEHDSEGEAGLGTAPAQPEHPAAASVASTAAAALIDEVVQSVAPYIMHVDAETDAVMVNTNNDASGTVGTESENESSVPDGADANSNSDANSEDEVAQKVELIKSMGFNLSDDTIAAFVKEMNGRVDLIVSALLKNNSRP